MTTATALHEAISRFGSAVKAKLSGKGMLGALEDQLRAPLETLLADIATILFFKAGDVVAIGEATPSTLKTVPTTRSQRTAPWSASSR